MSVDYKKVKQVLLIILFANLGVAALKIIVGNVINSTSMTADGFHSLTDGTSNIIALIGISFAAKPRDEEHPYGHSKLEILSSLVISGMLFFLGIKVLVESIDRFINPMALKISKESLIALIITLIVNFFVCKYEYRQGIKLGSNILISDSIHTRSDIYVSLGVLLTLIGIKLGLPFIIDPFISIVVAGFILHAAYEIFIVSSEILVDKAAIDKKRIREILMEFENVKDVHEIRSRGCQNDVHIDMHIMTDPTMSVEESHLLMHEIERRIQGEINPNIQLMVHIEPFYELEIDG